MKQRTLVFIQLPKLRLRAVRVFPKLAQKPSEGVKRSAQAFHFHISSNTPTVPQVHLEDPQWLLRWPLPWSDFTLPHLAHRCSLDTSGCLTDPIIPTMIPAINRVRRLDLKRSYGKLNKVLGSRCSGQATSALGYLRQNGTGCLATGTKKGRKPGLNRLLPLLDPGNL